MVTTRRLCLPGLVIALGPLSGCIAIPIAVPQERPFIDPAEESFEPGVTTAADVRSVFGPPRLASDNEWIYHNTRLGWQFAGCVGGYYSAGCAATPRGSADWYMQVRFVDDALLSDYQIASGVDFCGKHRLCISGDLVSQPAAVELDALSKTFPQQSEACQVYLFPKNQLSSARIEVDGQRIGHLVARDSYLYLPLPPGPHAISFIGAGLQSPSGLAEVDCTADSMHFIEYWVPLGAVRLRTRQLERKRGMREVGKRWRADPVNVYAAAGHRLLRGGEVVAVSTGEIVTLYEYDKEGSIASFGELPADAACGLQPAIDMHELTPVGGMDAFRLLDSKGRRVELAPVCNAEGNCELPSVLHNGTCEVTPATTISFERPEADLDAWLLVVEPGFLIEPETVYYDSVEDIVDLANCSAATCTIEVEALRALAGE